MQSVFIFEDLVYVKDEVIRAIADQMSIGELAWALTRENEHIRKHFFNNLSWDDLNLLKKKLHEVITFDLQKKKAAHKKLFAVVGTLPEYRNVRFQQGFDSQEDFEGFLTKASLPAEPVYGVSGAETPVCRFFETPDSGRLLQETLAKNKADGAGTLRLPNSAIQLVNFAVCPKCGRLFSFKELAQYYARPRPDSQYKAPADQTREDARMFCSACVLYFIPSLLVVGGKPERETQFLSRLQTMYFIEQHFARRDVRVLSNNDENFVRKDKFHTKSMPKETASVQLFLNNSIAAYTTETPAASKALVKGILNDVFLKELEEKPALVCNLVYYTPPALIPNLIEGANVACSDAIFGVWQ
ncbi:MAG: hypothetical protein LBD24_08425 [Spirochaetaceae bacterium]|jgi:hypothetical protein|nr:hypothetical protein [Spirochaetaceae bacterium]